MPVVYHNGSALHPLNASMQQTKNRHTFRRSHKAQKGSRVVLCSTHSNSVKYLKSFNNCLKKRKTGKNTKKRYFSLQFLSNNLTHFQITLLYIHSLVRYCYNLYHTVYMACCCSFIILYYFEEY